MIKISSNNNKNSPNNNKTPNISKLLIFQICNFFNSFHKNNTQLQFPKNNVRYREFYLVVLAALLSLVLQLQRW